MFFLQKHFAKNNHQQSDMLTVVHDVLIPLEPFAAIAQIAFGGVDGPDDTLLPQIAHEELQANQGKDTEAEDGEDHYI